MLESESSQTIEEEPQNEGEYYDARDGNDEEEYEEPERIYQCDNCGRLNKRKAENEREKYQSWCKTCYKERKEERRRKKEEKLKREAEGE